MDWKGYSGGRMDGSTMGDMKLGRRKLYILNRVTL